MNIAANLKRLRLRDSLTQDDLAQFLGCSPQAISRWERGEGYPEITLLPAIANIFNVTLDELCGMEEETRSARLAEITREYSQIISDASRGSAGAAEYLKEVLPEYPTAYGFWLTLAQILGGLIIAGEYPTVGQQREAIVILQRILDYCTDEQIRNNALCSIASVYQKLGEQETAESYVEKMPSSTLMRREEAAPTIYRGENQIRAIQGRLLHNAYQIWQQTRFAIHDTYILESDGDTFGYTASERIAILEIGAKALEMLTFDGDKHVYPLRIAVNYRGMAIIAAGEGQITRALDYIERCVEYAVEAQEQAGKSVTFYSAPLNRMTLFGESGSAGDTYAVLTRTGERAWHELDALRDEPRFIAAVEKLKRVL